MKNCKFTVLANKTLTSDSDNLTFLKHVCNRSLDYGFSDPHPERPTCVWRPGRQSALIGRQDLQFDQITGVGQQLGDLHQRAVLRAGLIYGQKDVPDVQRSTPASG